MNKSRRTSNLNNVLTYDGTGHVTAPAGLTLGTSPLSSDNSAKVASTAWVRTYVGTSVSTYVPQTRTITINGEAYDLSANRSWTIAGGVTSFNTRTGAITLISGDVTTALGFTPYNATNPAGYITSAALSGYVPTTRTVTVNGDTQSLSGNVSFTVAGGVTSFNTRTGAITLTSADVTGALGFTPYNATNPSGYLTSSTVLNTVLTPYVVGANTAVSATDTIETAIEKLQGQVNARGTGNGTVTSVSGTGTVSGLTLTGTVTASGSLTLGGTLSLTSGNVTTALGFTPVALSSAITGYAVGANSTLAATDTILGAFNKIQGQINARLTSYSETSTLANVTARGATTNGAITVNGDITVRGAGSSSSINMSDDDEGMRMIHCNSNRIGFLTQGQGWGSWCNDDGSWVSVSDITAYSDARIKENVVTVSNALDKVLQLRGVYYNRIGEDVLSLGVIAQETQTVVPEVVKEQNDGMLSVAYGNMAGLFIEAFKEQQAQIIQQKAQLDELMEIVKTLKGL